MNESLVKYLAGLLDADGSLSFNFIADHNREGRHYLGLHLRLASSTAVDKHGFVETLPSITGYGSVTYSGDRKQHKQWCVTKRADLEMLLPRLIKHMVIKARHWQWMLDIWRGNRTGKRVFTQDERAVLTAASKESRRLNRGPIKPKNFPTWAWLAGYLDGDGCYSYRSGVYKGNSRQWTINVSAVAHVNDIGVLEFLENSYGGRIQPQGQSDNVKVWVRSLGYNSRSFALDFLPRVAKHSRLKREKIDAMIHHHRQRLSVPGTSKTFCTIDECRRPSHGHGMCSLHYQRQLKAERKVQATV